jgi:hypothetical protein
MTPDQEWEPSTSSRAIAAAGIAVFMAMTFDEGLLPILLVLSLAVLGPAFASGWAGLKPIGIAFSLATLTSLAGWWISGLQPVPEWTAQATVLLFLLGPAKLMGVRWFTPLLVAAGLLLPGWIGVGIALAAIAIEISDLANGRRLAPLRDRERIPRFIWLAAVAATTLIADPIFELRESLQPITCAAEVLVCQAPSLALLLEGSSYQAARGGVMDMALAIILTQAAFMARLIDIWIKQQHGRRKS